MTKRRVAQWSETPRTWRGELECGHRIGDYDEGLDDEAKERVDREGTDCYACARAEKEAADLERRAREARAIIAALEARTTNERAEKP